MGISTGRAGHPTWHGDEQDTGPSLRSRLMRYSAFADIAARLETFALADSSSDHKALINDQGVIDLRKVPDELLNDRQRIRVQIVRLRCFRD